MLLVDPQSEVFPSVLAIEPLEPAEPLVEPPLVVELGCSAVNASPVDGDQRVFPVGAAPVKPFVLITTDVTAPAATSPALTASTIGTFTS